MTYTSEDAKREVGDSTDWKVGFDASLKKWKKIASGEITEGDYYTIECRVWCGFCFVAKNRPELKSVKSACEVCPGEKICGADYMHSETILQELRQLGKRKGWL